MRKILVILALIPLFNSCATFRVNSRVLSEDKKISETTINGVVIRSQPARQYENDLYPGDSYNETMVVVKF